MPAQGRAPHPFAYDASQTLPFAALSSDQQQGRVAQKGSGPRQPTRESEVMSRGAGLGRPPALGPVIGQDINPDHTGSVGMGTFGQDSGKQNPNIVSTSNAQLAKILNGRIKGTDRRIKPLTGRLIPKETLRIIPYHLAPLPNQSLPRSSEFQSQRRWLDNTNKRSHLNSRISTLRTTITHSRTLKLPKSNRKLWQKLELKHSLSFRPPTRTEAPLKPNSPVDPRVRGEHTRHLPVVRLSVIFSIKTEDQ
jgi:hypothetical protein